MVMVVSVLQEEFLVIVDLDLLEEDTETVVSDPIHSSVDGMRTTRSRTPTRMILLPLLPRKMQ